jgi:hypothetical protein
MNRIDWNELINKKQRDRPNNEVTTAKAELTTLVIDRGF